MLRGLSTRKDARLGLVINAILVAILFAPSVWMLKTIPPLWRDLDGYAQVTLPPSVTTILHYAPLYNFLARIPLFLGYAFYASRTGSTVPSLEFFRTPTLTDSGVYLLLFAQHAALCAASICVITAAAKSPLIRIALALLWASNPLFYAFAHCVGSETLSFILVVLLGAFGLMFVRREPKSQTRDWLIYGFLLVLCILTRHVNAVLATLLPFAFALRFVLARGEGARWLRRALLAGAVGVAGLAISHSTLRVLSHLNGIRYYSDVGYTFLWRLKFLDEVPPETRDQLLERVQHKTRSPDAQLVLESLRAQFRSGYDIEQFLARTGPLFPAADAESAQVRFVAALNETVEAFLFSPEPLFVEAIRDDLWRDWKLQIPSVVKSLFGSTAYYFAVPEKMPGCAGLVTFRNTNAQWIKDQFRAYHFTHKAGNFTYGALFFAWLVALVMIVAMSVTAAPLLLPYAIALVLTGWLIELANRILCEGIPRHTLPMWTLTIVSITIVFGCFGDAVLAQRKGPPGGS